jgi:Cu/Ag efflux protein CusF
MRRAFFTTAALLATVLLVGCRGSDDKDKTQDGKGKSHDIHGKVISMDAAKKKVNLDHDDIPGVMKAMKMEFGVTDANMLKDLKVGDEVHGTLLVKPGNEYLITQMKKY